tara:strand:+ start:1354 stop:1656 length:303 start_codon:yes stop_codon:yes gene_type:complete
MKQSEVLSSLVGRKARITMSHDPEDEVFERNMKDKEAGTGMYMHGASHDCWRHYGEFGEVVAVYKNGDHMLVTTLIMEQGKTVELEAKYLHIGGMVNDKK